MEGERTECDGCEGSCPHLEADCERNMFIDILGTESLGVRGLCCVVETRGRKIVIDPGLALGYRRDGLLPHPSQVAVEEQVRWRIAAALEVATHMDQNSYGADRALARRTRSSDSVHQAGEPTGERVCRELQSGISARHCRSIWTNIEPGRKNRAGHVSNHGRNFLT
jgi:hypothetical protein